MNQFGLIDSQANGLFVVHHSIINKDIVHAFQDAEFVRFVQIDSTLRNCEDQWDNSYSWCSNDDRQRNQWSGADLGMIDEVNETGS